MEYSETALQKVREDRLLIDGVDKWLYEEIVPHLGHRVLEVGCGMGNFARHLTDRELYVGTDISTESVAHVQRVYQGYPNIQARVANVVNDAFLGLVEYEIDTIFSLNVLEHVEDDERALRHTFRVLQPGGKLILVVPAHNWLYGTIDRAIGHYRRYGRGDMERLLDKTGFDVVSQKYMNALGALGWFVSGRIFHHETPPSGQLRFFNRLVPLLQSIERLAPMPFGISLLAVAMKLGGE